LFPTQPYINPHKALTFGIKSFFSNLKTCLLRWFHNEKDKKNVIEKKNFFEKHGACMVRSEKMVMEDGCNVFFFSFFGYQNFGEI
jgi:hypothetical protein